jgi:hypothetical protein
MNREQLRRAQDEIIAIATRRQFANDVPISSLQNGAPTIDELRTAIWPDFVPSIQSFLTEFNRNNQ